MGSNKNSEALHNIVSRVALCLAIAMCITACVCVASSARSTPTSMEEHPHVLLVVRVQLHGGSAEEDSVDVVDARRTSASPSEASLVNVEHPHTDYFDASPSRPVFGAFVEDATTTRLLAAVPLHREQLSQGTWMYYDRLSEGEPHHHHSDHDEHRHDKHHHRGGMHRVNATYLRVVVPNVPLEANSLKTMVNWGSDGSTSFTRQRRHPHRSAMHELSASASTLLQMQQEKISVTVLQQTNPRVTRSISFVSSGYSSSQRSQFDGDVTACLQALMGNDRSIDSAPWSRYYPLLNIYSVFQPSTGLGASRLRGPNHDCDGMKVCGPVSVNNNLECAYGTPDPSMLACSPEQVLHVASFAPVLDIVVVLVNDIDLGGSAFSGVAVITNSLLYMSYMLLHQLNHAAAGLGDEFSYGFSEPNPSTSNTPPNCATTTTTSSLDWSYWVGQGTVPAQPTAGCTFDNYYAPTNRTCIMASSTASSMCSVCKERLSTQLFLGGAGLRIDQPSCPPTSFDIYVNASDSATLTINHAFVLQNQNVDVVWTLPDGSQVSGVPTVTVSGSTLSSGANVVRVVVTDRSPLVRSSRRTTGMNISSTYVLRLWQPTTTCSWQQCTSSSAVTYDYCGVCTASTGNCSTDVVVTPVTQTPPSDANIDQEQTTVNIVATVLAATGAVALCAMCFVLVLYSSKQPHPVYDKTHGENTLNAIVIVTGTLSLVLAVLLIVFSVVYLPKAALFSQGVFIGSLVLASAVYAVAIVKLFAVVFHAPVLAAVCGMLLCLFGCGLFGVGLFAAYVYRNASSYALLSNIASTWLDYTSSNPALICSVQLSFQCSGFYHGCTPTPSSYCPTGCALANRDFANPCMEPFVDWLTSRAIRVAVVCLICGFFFAIAAIIDCIHCVRTIRARASAKGRRSYRKDERPPVVPITTSEVEQVRDEFRKADRDHRGTLEGQEVLEFIQTVFNDPLSPQEKQMFLTAGPLTCEDVLRLYFPHVVLSQIDPRQLTPEEAEEAKDSVDLQRLQFAKLEQFMRAAGTLSPEELHRIYQEHARQKFATTGKELLEVIRLAAVKQSTSEDAAMCEGLSPQELEGLRCAWVSINPRIVGDLDDDQLDQLFQWTHGTILHSHEHFVRWKDMLDVRRTGVIGWGEFCYPFAQRTLLARAREYLFINHREVPHEMLSKAQVAEEFGPTLVDQCFLLFEEMIPIERVVEQALRNQEEAQEAIDPLLRLSKTA